MSFVDDFFALRDHARTLIIAPYTRRDANQQRFEEFIGLCEAAQLTPAGVDNAPVREIHPGTYFRAGQIERFIDSAAELDAHILAVDTDLTPVQQRQLERAAGLPVLDRSAIILMIFGRRAKSKAGKLQVALAQNEYILPRLVGLWGHFDREKGGIGMRGAGEKQIELDRRIIQQQIARLKRELRTVQRTQELHRAKRRRGALFHVAIVGYTNVGKSSLLRHLSDRSVFVRDMPFATLDTLTRRITLPDQTTFLLTDTVGFVQDLPHGLVEAFKSTLEEAVEADALIHVLDASAPEPQTQLTVTNQVLAELGTGIQPTLYVLNKMDLLRGELPPELDQLAPAVTTSITHDEGVDAIVEWIRDQVTDHADTATVTIPIDRPDLIRLAEAASVRPGKWSPESVEYEIPNDDMLLTQLAG